MGEALRRKRPVKGGKAEKIQNASERTIDRNKILQLKGFNQMKAFED